jgi:hypothetical protein
MAQRMLATVAHSPILANISVYKACSSQARVWAYYVLTPRGYFVALSSPYAVALEVRLTSVAIAA